MKFFTIVGARPQFIKAAAFSLEVAKHDNIEEVICHTGQHYDNNMSDIFFNELGIPQPQYKLNINNESHTSLTAKIMLELEPLLKKEAPDFVIVYGDTNSTLAAAITSAQNQIPIIHIEAGLREFNLNIPEEINKRVTDSISSWLIAPTKSALKNLIYEGQGHSTLYLGDIMSDTAHAVQSRLSSNDIKCTLNKYGVSSNNFILATAHRASLKSSPEKLQELFTALSEIGLPVLIPLHPATTQAIKKFKLSEIHELPNLIIVPSCSYKEMICLISQCRMTATDSGGLIKESYLFQKPCVITDTQTEWVENVSSGWAAIAGPNKKAILQLSYNYLEATPSSHSSNNFDGHTAQRLIKALMPKKSRITPELELKPIHEQDLQMIFDWNNNPDIMKNLGRFTTFTWEQHLSWFEKLKSSKDKLKELIVIKNSSDICGMVSLMNINQEDKTAEMGVTIGDLKFRNKGIAAEAIKLMMSKGKRLFNLDNFYAKIHEDNFASICLFQSLSFRPKKYLNDTQQFIFEL